MKKILFVANVARQHLNRFHLPTIRALKRRGWQVDCASAGDEPVPECDHDYKMSWQRSPFTAGTFKGLSELKKLLKNEQYDLVYCHTPVGGLEARLAAKNARKHGTKVVYCPHGLHFYQGAPAKSWLFYYPIEKRLAGKTDVLFTVNEEDYELASEKFAKSGCKIELVPEVGINTTRLQVNNPISARKEVREKYGIPMDAFVCVYIAELIDNKNQGMLLRMLKRLLSEGRKVYLLLVGPDTANGKFQTEAKNLGVADHVIFTGWQSEIGPILCASDVCTASSIREGFGINLAEAMYCGLPVVATDNRGHRTILENGENGFLVPVNDAKMMAERVAELMDDEALFMRLSHQDASKYDADSIAEELADRLEEVAR